MQETVHSIVIPALHEGRRLRIDEERQRRAVEAEKLQEAEAGLERMQALVSTYTKDFLALKHEALQAEQPHTHTCMHACMRI